MPLGLINPSNKDNLPQPQFSEACESVEAAPAGPLAPAAAPAAAPASDVMASVGYACPGSPLPKSPPATLAAKGEGDAQSAIEAFKMAAGAVGSLLFAIVVYRYRDYLE